MVRFMFSHFQLSNTNSHICILYTTTPPPHRILHSLYKHFYFPFATKNVHIFFLEMAPVFNIVERATVTAIMMMMAIRMTLHIPFLYKLFFTQFTLSPYFFTLSPANFFPKRDRKIRCRLWRVGIRKSGNRRSQNIV